jgi:hypothetical protein
MSKLLKIASAVILVATTNYAFESACHAQRVVYQNNGRVWRNPPAARAFYPQQPSGVVYPAQASVTYQSYRPSYANVVTPSGSVNNSYTYRGNVNSYPTYNYSNTQPANTYFQPTYTYTQPSYTSSQPVYTYPSTTYPQPVYGNGVVGASYYASPSQARGATIGGVIGGVIAGDRGANIGAAIGLQSSRP